MISTRKLGVFPTPGALKALIAPFVLAALSTACAREAPIPPPPETRVDEVVEVLHGVEVPDPYRWLEDQEAPETRAWIERQNAYTDAVLEALPGRDSLRQTATRLIQTDTVDTPVARGDRYFFAKRLASQDQEVLYLRQGRDGEDQVLVDPHPLSPDHTVSVDLLDVSRDGKTLAYGLREGGRDEIRVQLFDVDGRADLADGLPAGRYFGVTFTPDGRGLLYVRHDASGPRLFIHALGTAGEGGADRLLFGDGYGPEKLMLMDLSPDGRWLTATVLYGSSADQTEIHVKDLSADGPWRTVVDDVEARFNGAVRDGVLYLQTNWEAPNGRILAVDPVRPERSGWRELIPERSDAVIRDVELVAGRLFINYLEDVRSRVVIFGPRGAEQATIAFDTLGSVGGLTGEWDRDEVFFLFTSFHVPTTVYRYDASAGSQEVWDQVEIPLDTSDFEVRQVFYSSLDGAERIPMFLVHRRGLALDGSHPTLLTGYGGFNVSLTPRFTPETALWVANGGVFAVANLRGGGEYGENWHRAGMLEHKQNVFDDFIAAAQYLIGEGYTRPSKLAVRGTSNGGLLVGALLTQRPDLVAAVVCGYPLLDMLRYQRFLVARFWVPEYGSAEDPEQFPYLYAYSPYHHVDPGIAYPAVLFLSGDGDTRVAPLHARKMAARMQAVNPSAEPVLLRYHTQSGHAGGMPVSQRIDDTVDAMSFLAWRLGMDLPGAG